MTDYTISCDAFARLASVHANMHSSANGWFRTIRIDHGIAIATNRVILAAERVPGGNGIVHVIADPALVEQCRREAPFDSKLTIIVNEALSYAMAKTTLGYQTTANLFYSGPEANELDRWREVAGRAKTKPGKPSGGMFWDCRQIATLAAAAPSGQVVFEEVINCDRGQRRPTVMRDISTHDWFGLFNPFDDNETHPAAVLPSWVGA